MGIYVFSFNRECQQPGKVITYKLAVLEDITDDCSAYGPVETMYDEPRHVQQVADAVLGDGVRFPDR